MRADLEAELMRRVHDGELARDVISDLLARGAIASPKQGWRTLEKWCDKDWYDFGVALDLGWMTEKAPCGRSVQREPVEPFEISVRVNGERHTVGLTWIDAHGRPLVPSDADLLKAEVERRTKDRLDALAERPPKSPAEWREIAEEQVRELGVGEYMPAPPLLRELTFGLTPATLPEDAEEKKRAITALLVGSGAGEKAE